MASADYASVGAFFDSLFQGIRSIPTPGRRAVAYIFAVLISLAYAAGVLLPSFFGARWSWLLGLATLGAAIFAALIKRSDPPALPPNISVLPGASPVRPSQGDQLRSWGRQAELDLLLSWITGKKVAAIILWGPPAVGKTSLVSAGLQSDLRSRLPNCKYIETDASQDFEANLVARFLEEDKELVHELDSIIVNDRAARQVVVLDDASFAYGDGLRRLIETIKLAISQPYPYERVFVVILDDAEFKAIWERQAWRPHSRRDGLKVMPLQRLRHNDAVSIAKHLKKEASIHVDDEVLALTVRDIAEVGSSSPKVSPFALGSLIALMAREAGSGKDFGPEDYQSLGKAPGLMADFLLGQLDPVAPEFSRDLLRRIETAFRKSTSITLETLGDIPESARYEAVTALKVLSSPELRVLRLNSETGEYRLIEEWRAALAVAAAGRDPAVIAKEKDLKARYSEWETHRQEGWSFVRKYGKVRYLLTLGELRALRKFEGKLSLNSGVGNFVNVSKEYRGGKWVLFSALSIALISLGTAAWSAVNQEKLWAAGIPSDFLQYSKNVKHITIRSNCMLTDLAWLPRELETLDAVCERVNSLEGIPPKLTQLKLSTARISSLKGLPGSVTDLDISYTLLGEKLGLDGSSVVRLNVAGVPIHDLTLLPSSLKSLVLSHPDIKNIDGLPSGLDELVLIGTSVSSLKGLPSSITKLRIRTNRIGPIDYLPPGLVSLDTDVPLRREFEYPQSLRTLSIRRGFSYIPSGITSLEFSGGASVLPGASVPSGLKRFWVNGYNESAGLGGFPSTVKELKFIWPDGARFGDLLDGLKVLDLSLSRQVSDISGIRARLISLNLTMTAVKDFANVPDSVTELIDQFCGITLVKELPSNLRRLDLSGCSGLNQIEHLPATLDALNLSGTAFTSLPHPLPARLKELDISDTKITGTLPQLPKNLAKLTIKVGQFKSIKSLPTSVRDIVFVGDNREVPPAGRD